MPEDGGTPTAAAAAVVLDCVSLNGGHAHENEPGVPDNGDMLCAKHQSYLKLNGDFFLLLLKKHSTFSQL